MQIYDYIDGSWSTTPTMNVSLSHKSGKGGMDVNK
jgi:hypothetical protein